MNYLLKVGLLCGAVVLSLPWLSVSLDASGLKQDVQMAPELSKAGASIKAHAIAHYVMRVARQRGFEISPEDVQVEVSAAQTGDFPLQGGEIKVAPNQALTVQKVSIQLKCHRYVYGSIKREVELALTTEGMGLGGASTFPGARDEAEAEAPADVAEPTDG
jgi:hypothetical protein